MEEGNIQVKTMSFSKPLFNIEVNIVTSKLHHYVLWSVAAIVIGIGASYGILAGGDTVMRNLAYSEEPPPPRVEYLNSIGQGSDDATSTEEHISGFYTTLNPKKVLKLNASAYLIGDVSTGDIILEKNGISKYPMASVTKLMTAVIDLETIDQREYATVTPATLKYYPAVGDLVPNEIIRVSDLIYPLLVVSSNVAAEVFADHEGRANFLSEMNAKAESLGMINTNYDDPSGLSPKSYSTVEDLFKLAQYIKVTEPQIFDIGRIREYSILGHTWNNANHQLIYSTFGGGKNGFTDEAAKTTVSTFNLPFNKTEKRQIAVILLHTNDREGDIQKILSYVSSNLRYQYNSLDVGSANAPAPKGDITNPDK